MRVPYIVFNLPKKNDNVLQSDILSVLELHYGVSPTIHIHSKTYGPTVIKYASFKLISPPDPVLKKLHGFVLNGHHLIVSQRKDWDFDKLCYHHPELYNVWIYNIAKEATEEDVWKHFETCGMIRLLYFIRDERRGTPQYCFVLFDDHKALDRALKLNGQPFLSQTVRLKEFVVDKGLFMRNLNPSTKLNDIVLFLQDLQPLHVCFSASACSARLYFSNEHDYWKAIVLNRKHLNGVPVSISGSQTVTRNIYVTNLPPGTSVLKLKSMFDWNIKSLKKCNYGITKLTFESCDKAEVALRVSDPVIDGANVTLYSDFAQASYAVCNGPDAPCIENNVVKVEENGRNRDNISNGASAKNELQPLLKKSCPELLIKKAEKKFQHKVAKRKIGRLVKGKASGTNLDKISACAPRVKPKLKKIIMKKKDWSISSL